MKKKKTDTSPLALAVALDPRRCLLNSSPSGQFVDDDEWPWDDGGANVKEAGKANLWNDDWSD